MRANIELLNLVLNIQIGSYTKSDVVPDKHILDILLSINPELVLINDDKMDRVFDYDPLIRAIQRMAAEMHYETQERFITRIVDICAKEEEIMDVEIFLRKSPVCGSSGELGVRLKINELDLKALKSGE
jgi:dihydroneopterin aldolase